MHSEYQSCGNIVDADLQSSKLTSASVRSKGAPVPGTLEALREAAHSWVLWALSRHGGCWGFDCSSTVIGALAVAAA